MEGNNNLGNEPQKPAVFGTDTNTDNTTAQKATVADAVKNTNPEAQVAANTEADAQTKAPDFFAQELARRNEQIIFAKKRKRSRKRIIIIIGAIAFLIIASISAIIIILNNNKAQSSNNSSEKKQEITDIVAAKKSFNSLLNYIVLGTESDEDLEENNLENVEYFYANVIIDNLKSANRDEYIKRLIEKYDDFKEANGKDNAVSVSRIGYYYKYVARSYRSYSSIIYDLVKNDNAEEFNSKVISNFQLPDDIADDNLNEYMNYMSKYESEYLKVAEKTYTAGCVTADELKYECLKDSNIYYGNLDTYMGGMGDAYQKIEEDSMKALDKIYGFYYYGSDNEN